jgi:hypothetical protein
VLLVPLLLLLLALWHLLPLSLQEATKSGNSQRQSPLIINPLRQPIPNMD